MMKIGKKGRVLGAILLVCALSLGVVSATQGTEDNPLVSLSYLQNIFAPAMEAETEQKLTDAQSTYEAKLDSKIQSLGLSGEGTSSFVVVDLVEGQTITGSVGCELLLRVGSATCLGSDTTGLIDSSTGSVLSGGASLLTNHLYVVTIDTRSVTAVGGSVKILAKGSYSLS